MDLQRYLMELNPDLLQGSFSTSFPVIRTLPSPSNMKGFEGVHVSAPVTVELEEKKPLTPAEYRRRSKQRRKKPQPQNPTETGIGKGF